MYKNYTTDNVVLPRGHKFNGWLRPCLLFMLLFFGALSLKAQQISVAFKKAPLKTVIKELKKQSHYNFSITEDLLNSALPVDLTVTNADIKTTLDLLIKDRPFSYTIQNGTVVIFEKVIGSNVVAEGAFYATGVVYDEDNRAMPGATIRIKGTDRYTPANASGGFKIGVPNDKAILQISFMGYTTLELPAKPYMGVVKLQKSESVLDEVQVRQYGQSTTRKSVSNAVTITRKDLQESPAPNVLQALAGRVPGLTISQNGSNASANYAVTIRGTSSLGALPGDELNYRNQPLFILDGFPLAQGTDGQTAAGVNITGLNQSDKSIFELGKIGQPNTQGLSVLYSLNPNDVESITVLKDADATAIYGSQGANGVILITTRRAKPGRMTIEGNANYGYSTQVQKLKLMNTQQYLAMRSEAISLDSTYFPFGATSPYNTIKHDANNFPENFIWDPNRNVDWQKILLGAKPNINANLGFNSGTDLTTVRVNFGYTKNLSNIPGAPSKLVDGYGEGRGTGSMAFTARSQNNRFRVNSLFSFATSSSNLPSGVLERLIYLPPNAPDLFTPNGDLNFAGWRVIPGVFYINNGLPQSAFPDQVLQLLKPYQMNTLNGNANVDMQYDIVKGLTLTARGSYNFNNMNNYAISSSGASTDPIVLAAGGGIDRSTSFANQNLSTWSSQVNLGYTKTWGDHNINLLAGGQYQINHARFNMLSASGFVADQLMYSVSGATTITGTNTSADGDIKQSRLASGYATVYYGYKNRYLLSLNGRKDGSSDYSLNTYGTFGSVAGAWIFSDEPWLKFLRGGDIFTYGKIRASVGRTGSPVSIPNISLASYTNYNAGDRYDGISPLYLARAANSDVHSSYQNSKEFGLDLGFMSDQLTMSINHYVKRTYDMIMANGAAAPAVGGLMLPFNMPGVVKSFGWEGSINYRSNLNGKWRYSVGMNIAKGDNILESYQNFQLSPYRTYYTIGESLNRLPVYQVTGINNQGGYYWPGSDNGTKPTPDVKYISNPQKYSGGIQFNISYSNFSLGTNWSFARQTGFAASMSNTTPGTFGLYGNSQSNQLAAIDALTWHKPGDEATALYQRYTAGGTSLYGSYYAASSNLFLRDIKYLGLKNARLDYRLPAALLAKAKIVGLSIYASADNLFYITNYNGLNPENGASNAMLIRRNVNFGLNVTL